MTLPNKAQPSTKRENGRPEAYPGRGNAGLDRRSPLDDVGPRLSKLILFCAALNAGLHLAASIRTRGLRRSALFFVLGTGLPAAGELLATGPLKLLRHRVRYRIAGVPLAILLGWYAVIHGSFVVARRVSERAPSWRGCRGRPFRPLRLSSASAWISSWTPPASTSVSGSGTRRGLRWRGGGAKRTQRSAARQLPGLDLAGRGRDLRLRAGCEDEAEDRLPALLLLPYYLAAVGWALKRRKFGYLLLSAPFPVALYAALENG